MQAKVVRFAIRLDNNVITYPVKFFKCGFEEITVNSTIYQEYRGRYNHLAEMESGSENMHLIEVYRNESTMAGRNQVVIDLTEFYYLT